MPRREGSSPRIDVPDRHVTGAKTCVSGQMPGRGEGTARDIDQESRGGPNPDSRHAGQDRMKRVRKHKTLDFLRHFLSLCAQRRQLSRQARQDDAGVLSAQDHDRLLRERLNDFCSPSLAHARSELDPDGWPAVSG